MKGKELAITGTRKKLIEKYRRARGTDRARVWRDEIVEYNSRNPDFRITRSTLQKSLAEKRKRERYMKAHAGQYLPRTRQRSLGDIGEFANVE